MRGAGIRIAPSDPEVRIPSTEVLPGPEPAAILVDSQFLRGWSNEPIKRVPCEVGEAARGRQAKRGRSCRVGVRSVEQERLKGAPRHCVPTCGVYEMPQNPHSHPISVSLLPKGYLDASSCILRFQRCR